jgi:hypothetical protein
MIIKKSLHSAWFILKLVIPFAILSDILQYYGLIEYLAFIFTPITDSLNLPAGVALALASGVFLNIYAAIAVAASFSLSGYEWTIIGVFVSICHSLPMEGAILKKVGVKLWQHFSVRFIFAYLGAYIASVITPTDLSLVSAQSNIIDSSFIDYLFNSIINAGLLATKVVVLVLAIMISFDLIRNIKVVAKFLDKHIYLSSLGVGGLIGITYGAAVLLQEIHHIPYKTRVLLLSFLLIAHALIEETLLYAIFNADILNILIIRVGLALVLVLFVWLYLRAKS